MYVCRSFHPSYVGAHADVVLYILYIMIHDYYYYYYYRSYHITTQSLSVPHYTRPIVIRFILLYCLDRRVHYTVYMVVCVQPTHTVLYSLYTTGIPW